MPFPDTAFDLLTVKEVAQLLHCSKAHVGNVLAGRVRGCAPIPSVRLGRRTLVRRQALQAWISANENGSLESSSERSRRSA
jgi:excisionase family DNA binding protein